MEKNPVQVFTSRGPERIANCSVTTVEVCQSRRRKRLSVATDDLGSL